jgi:hypothetical protein
MNRSSRILGHGKNGHRSVSRGKYNIEGLETVKEGRKIRFHEGFLLKRDVFEGVFDSGPVTHTVLV